MKLNEVFDSPVDWSFSTASGYADDTDKRQAEPNQTNWAYDTYKFTVDDEKYKISFYRVTSKNIEFQPTPKNLPYHVDYVVLTDSSDSDDITGKGNAYKVFSTALDIIKTHMKRTKFPVLVGSKVNTPSRIKLYSRMFDKIASAKWRTDRQKHDPDYIKDANDEILWLLA